MAGLTKIEKDLLIAAIELIVPNHKFVLLTQHEEDMNTLANCCSSCVVEMCMETAQYQMEKDIAKAAAPVTTQ